LPHSAGLHYSLRPALLAQPIDQSDPSGPGAPWCDCRAPATRGGAAADGLQGLTDEAGRRWGREIAARWWRFGDGRRWCPTTRGGHNCVILWVSRWKEMSVGASHQKWRWATTVWQKTANSKAQCTLLVGGGQAVTRGGEELPNVLFEWRQRGETTCRVVAPAAHYSGGVEWIEGGGSDPTWTSGGRRRVGPGPGARRCVRRWGADGRQWRSSGRGGGYRAAWAGTREWIGEVRCIGWRWGRLLGHRGPTSLGMARKQLTFLLLFLI
jgi:hypothetical protein